jgi:predicted flavoprotein YhiN
MLRVVTIRSSSAVVRDDIGESKIDFLPLDLGGLSVKEAFVLGMAYSLLKNRGLPIEETPPSVPTLIDRHPDSEEI